MLAMKQSRQQQHYSCAICSPALSYEFFLHLLVHRMWEIVHAFKKKTELQTTCFRLEHQTGQP